VFTHVLPCFETQPTSVSLAQPRALQGIALIIRTVREHHWGVQQYRRGFVFLLSLFLVGPKTKKADTRKYLP
jgi:hypothetical protein